MINQTNQTNQTDQISQTNQTNRSTLPKRWREAINLRLEENKRGDEVKERANSEKKEAKEEKKRLEEKNERELEVEWKGKLRRLAIEHSKW